MVVLLPAVRVGLLQQVLGAAEGVWSYWVQQVVAVASPEAVEPVAVA